MPWMERSPVAQREEFVTLLETQAVSSAELCRRIGVSRRKGYKWLGRFHAAGRRKGLKTRTHGNQAVDRAPLPLHARLHRVPRESSVRR